MSLACMFYRFIISLQDLLDGEDVAPCPSCTLRIRIVFDEDYLKKMEEACDSEDTRTEDVNTSSS